MIYFSKIACPFLHHKFLRKIFLVSIWISNDKTKIIESFEGVKLLKFHLKSANIPFASWIITNRGT